MLRDALRILLVGCSVLAVSGMGVVAFEVVGVATTLHENAVDISGSSAAPPPPFLGAFEGGITMLVVGTDNDAAQGDEFGERSGVRNDVNILLHVSADHSNAVVVSLPRDLVISHPECRDPDTAEVFDAMSAQPLNAAYSRGGLGCTVATVSDLTGLAIGYAAATSFNGVIAMTDAIGGVDVCLDEPIFDPDSGVDLPEGTSTVSGQSALAFLRNRHGIGNGSDLSRIGGQQQYLASLLRKIRSESTLSDPAKLYGLAQAIAHDIVPSTTLESADSMVSLALTLKDIDLEKVVFVQYPVTAYTEDPNKVQPDPELATELFSRIAADEPFSLADDATATGTILAPSDSSPLPEAPPPTSDTIPEAGAEETETIDGLLGQNASQQTCATGFTG